jgi:hypothetical protein
MIPDIEPRSKREARVLHLVLGALGATQEERQLAFLIRRYRGYPDALNYVEELRHGRPGNRPTLDAQI